MPATPVTWRDEITANTTTTGTQNEPEIVQLANGNIIVAWTSSATTGVASDAGLDIVGQIFDPAGNKVGGEIRLNNGFFLSDEQDISIAALPGGGFISTFEDNDGGGVVNIRLNEYDANGVRVTDSSTVVSDAAGNPTFANPVIAVSSATQQAIFYQKFDGTLTTIVGKTYNATTDTYGVETNVLTGNTYNTAQVAKLTNGNYAVVANETSGDSAIAVNIMTPTLGSTGAFFVGGTNTNGQSDSQSAIAALTGGGFVVAWTNVDTQDTDIQLAVYSNTGTLVATDLFAGTAGSTDNHNEPSLAALADGSFVLYFDDDGSGTTGLKAVHYSAAGVSLGSTFTVASSPTSIVSTGLADGRSAVAWWANDGGGEISLEITDTRDVPNSSGTVIAGTINGETIVESGGVRSYFAGPGDDIVKVNSVINSDVHNGGGGTDLIDWSGDTSESNGVTFNLAAGTATAAGGGATEVMTGFENLIGTNRADIIIGNSGPNFLAGGADNDDITGGGGADGLGGGAGADTFIYTAVSDSPNATPDVIVDFQHLADRIVLGVSPTAIGVVQGGGISLVFVTAPGGTMQINVTGDVEGTDLVTGGIGIVIQGDNTATALTGTAFGDGLFGNGGNDLLQGGLGPDALFGGAGQDTFLFVSAAESNASTPDVIADFQSGVDKIDLSGAGVTAIGIVDAGGNSLIFASTPGGQIQIGSIGTTQGGDITANVGVTIQGGSAATVVAGGSFNDTLFGEGGNDQLIGGLGADVLWGGAGADTFSYFTAAQSNAATPDLIADFQTGVDKIDLTGTGVTAIGIANNILFGSGPGGISMQIGSLQTIVLSDVILGGPAPAPLFADANHAHGMDGAMF